MRCAGIRDLGDTDGRRLALRSCSCRMQRDPAAMPVPDLPACLLLLSSTPMSPSVRRASCKQETSTHMSCKKFQANLSAMSFFYTSKYMSTSANTTMPTIQSRFPGLHQEQVCMGAGCPDATCEYPKHAALVWQTKHSIRWNLTTILYTSSEPGGSLSSSATSSICHPNKHTQDSSSSSRSRRDLVRYQG